MLRYLKFAIIHVGFEEFNLLVSRTGGQELIVGGQLHFKDIVIMCFDDLLVSLGHVLSVTVDKTLVISNRHSFQIFANGDRSNAVINLNFHHFPSLFHVPPFYNSKLISSDDRCLSGMKSCTVDRFIMLKGLVCCTNTSVINSEIAIFTASVESIFLLIEASNRRNITLEVCIIGAQVLVGPFEVIYLYAIIHADDYLALIFGDLDAVGSRSELDCFGRIARTSRWVPEFDSVVV